MYLSCEGTLNSLRKNQPGRERRALAARALISRKLFCIRPEAPILYIFHVIGISYLPFKLPTCKKSTFLHHK